MVRKLRVQYPGAMCLVMNRGDRATRFLMTIVPPDNRGQYSLARFCSDGVICSRNGLLWRTDLNGNNNAPLLPPAGSKQ